MESLNSKTDNIFDTTIIDFNDIILTNLKSNIEILMLSMGMKHRFKNKTKNSLVIDR